MADSGATLIVADAGPLIGLTKLGLLDLLPHCFDAVYIPRTVLSEATGSRTHPGAETLLRFGSSPPMTAAGYGSLRTR